MGLERKVFENKHIQDAFQRSGWSLMLCTSQHWTIKMTFGNGRRKKKHAGIQPLFQNSILVYVYLSGYVIQQDGDSRDRF